MAELMLWESQGPVKKSTAPTEGLLMSGDLHVLKFYMIVCILIQSRSHIQVKFKYSVVRLFFVNRTISSWLFVHRNN